MDGWLRKKDKGERGRGGGELKPACEQVGDWVPVAARVQGRDPARLSPLKPLPPNIVIRPAFKKAEEPYEGIMERANPGDFGPDMKAVVKVEPSPMQLCSSAALPLT